jgi:hypothetical protein
MEEIIICIHKTNTSEVMDALKNGWRVKLISSFCQPVSVGEGCYGISEGDFGAYVVLTRKEQ